MEANDQHHCQPSSDEDVANSEHSDDTSHEWERRYFARKKKLMIEARHRQEWSALKQVSEKYYCLQRRQQRCRSEPPPSELQEKIYFSKKVQINLYKYLDDRDVRSCGDLSSGYMLNEDDFVRYSKYDRSGPTKGVHELLMGNCVSSSSSLSSTDKERSPRGRKRTRDATTKQRAKRRIRYQERNSSAASPEVITVNHPADLNKISDVLVSMTFSRPGPSHAANPNLPPLNVDVNGGKMTFRPRQQCDDSYGLQDATEAHDGHNQSFEAEAGSSSDSQTRHETDDRRCHRRSKAERNLESQRSEEINLKIKIGKSHGDVIVDYDAAMSSNLKDKGKGKGKRTKVAPEVQHERDLAERKANEAWIRQSQLVPFKDIKWRMITLDELVYQLYPPTERDLVWRKLLRTRIRHALNQHPNPRPHGEEFPTDNEESPNTFVIPHVNSFGNIFRDGEVTIDGLEKDSATKNNQGHNDDSVDDVADDEVDDENEFVSLDPEEILEIENLVQETRMYHRDDDNANNDNKFNTNTWQKGFHEGEEIVNQSDAFKLYTAVAGEKFMNKGQQESVWNNFYRKVSDECNSYRSHRRKIEKSIPKTMLDIIVKRKVDQQIQVFTSDRFPRKQYQKKKFDILAIYYYVKLRDLVDFHLSLHQGDEATEIKRNIAEGTVNIDIGIDGVPMSNSGTRKLTEIGLQFEGCQLIYNYGLLVRAKIFNVSHEILLSKIIKDLTMRDCCCRLKHLVMDIPMRDYVLHIKQFNAFYGCDQCLCQGKKRTDCNTICYPAVFFNIIERSRRAFEELGSLAEQNDIVDDKTIIMGHKGKTALLKIPYFDPQVSVPVDPMHLLQGVCSKLFDMTFVNPKGKENNWKIVVNDKINSALKTIELPNCFNREFRDVDISLYKTQEFKTTLIFGFDHVCKILNEYDAVNEAKIISSIAFFFRILMLPDPWFEIAAKKSDLRKLGSQIYKDYENLFGANHCTINIHLLFAHLYDWRMRQPLGSISASKFENFYGENKRRYTPGTPSEGIQMMRNSFLARRGGHFCKNKININVNKETNNVNNSLFTDSEMNFYKAIAPPEDGVIRARRLETTKYVPAYSSRDYNWTCAGIFIVDIMNKDVVSVNENDVFSSAVLINNSVIAVATRDMSDV